MSPRREESGGLGLAETQPWDQAPQKRDGDISGEIAWKRGEKIVPLSSRLSRPQRGDCFSLRCPPARGTWTNHRDDDKAKFASHEEWLNALRFFNVTLREV